MEEIDGTIEDSLKKKLSDSKLDEIIKFCKNIIKKLSYLGQKTLEQLTLKSF
jgi:flagellar biosynthesis/type III secretory pathway chaperone